MPFRHIGQTMNNTSEHFHAVICLNHHFTYIVRTYVFVAQRYLRFVFIKNYKIGLLFSRNETRVASINWPTPFSSLFLHHPLIFPTRQKNETWTICTQPHTRSTYFSNQKFYLFIFHIRYGNVRYSLENNVTNYLIVL